jgi:hypothetical protein
VSGDAPLVLICIARWGERARPFLLNHRSCVNALDVSRRPVAECFAARRVRATATQAQRTKARKERPPGGATLGGHHTCQPLDASLRWVICGKIFCERPAAGVVETAGWIRPGAGCGKGAA